MINLTRIALTVILVVAFGGLFGCDTSVHANTFHGGLHTVPTPGTLVLICIGVAALCLAKYRS